MRGHRRPLRPCSFASPSSERARTHTHTHTQTEQTMRKIQKKKLSKKKEQEQEVHLLGVLLGVFVWSLALFLQLVLLVFLHSLLGIISGLVGSSSYQGRRGASLLQRREKDVNKRKERKKEKKRKKKERKKNDRLPWWYPAPWPWPCGLRW